MADESPELIFPDPSQMTGAQLLGAGERLRDLQSEQLAQDRARLDEIRATLLALTMVVKQKLNVTEAEWLQAVAAAKNRP
jgi:hypothetical protein